MIHVYKNGNYNVAIFPDGTKMRRTDDDMFIPDFAENCDVKITDKCCQGCGFCYEGCTAAGKHGNILGYKNLLDSLHPYTELAMNGNDLDHPDLVEFLRILKDKRVFANITISQNQLHDNIDLIRELQEKKLVHGIGVSLQHADMSLINDISGFKNVVIHTINGILTKADIEFLKGRNVKILILGYKTLQRGVRYKKERLLEISSNQEYLYSVLDKITDYFNVVSFDNLALEQLEVRRLFDESTWERFYMGDDGTFTFYIDMVNGEFAKNSLSPVRYKIGDKTIDEMFKIIKDNN